MQQHIIAGIDPGATVGIAIIDLSGRKIASESTTGGIAQAVRIIEAHGTPSLVCCDVYPPPEMARRIASYFSCRLYVPQREIREAEKREIARGADVSNNHERDAYCAAVLGFRSHANKLRQIDALAELASQEKDGIKHMLLKGYRLRDAFLSLRGPVEETEAGQERKPRVEQKPPSLDELRDRVASLARENAHLRLLSERLEGEKRALEKRMRLLENGVRRSVLRDSELRKLRFRLELAARRLQPGKRKAQMQKPQQKNAQKDALNSGEPTIDLEEMVAEYRKGKK